MGASATQKWDFISVVGMMLCLGPTIASFVKTGPPTDWALWEWFVVFPLSTAFLGAPQLAMLIFIIMTDVRWLRVLFLATSVLLLGYFGWFLATVDLTSSSTAGVGVMFLALYLGAGAFVFALGVLWSYERFRA